MPLKITPKIFNKFISLSIGFFILINSNCAGNRDRSSSQIKSYNYDYEEFDIDDLNYYGSWVYVDGYGKVWNPNVGRNWRPFSYGDWVYDGEDWFWYSYEPYGWVVYHYGNWYYDSFYGWVWIPGRRWSRAQVIWIQYDNYIGWAPLPPPGVYWNDPWIEHRYVVWNIVETRNFTQPGISRYRVNQIPGRRNFDSPTVHRRSPQKRIIDTQAEAPAYVMPNRTREVTGRKERLYRWDPPQEKINQTREYREKVQKEVANPSRKKEKNKEKNNNQNISPERKIIKRN